MERWNHTIHYHKLLLDAIPRRCARALDIGCGEGYFTRILSQQASDTVGIDMHAPSIAQAMRHNAASDIKYILGDALTYPFENESFDFVVSVAALHHMDAGTALRRMKALVQPGGTIAILGLTAMQYPKDLPREFAAFVVSRVLRLHYVYWEHPSPTVWPPSQTFDQLRALVDEILPGARVRRLLLWRYVVVWTKPAPLH